MNGYADRRADSKRHLSSLPSNFTPTRSVEDVARHFYDLIDEGVDRYRELRTVVDEFVAAANLQAAIASAPVIEPAFLTVDQAARRLNFSRSKVYELINCGALESRQEGRSRRVTPAAIDRYIESTQVAVTAG